MLALELLDQAVINCGTPFHTQVATKSFMGILVKLLKIKDVAPEVIFLIFKMINRFQRKLLP